MRQELFCPLCKWGKWALEGAWITCSRTRNPPSCFGAPGSHASLLALLSAAWLLCFGLSLPPHHDSVCSKGRQDFDPPAPGWTSNTSSQAFLAPRSRSIIAPHSPRRPHDLPQKLMACREMGHEEFSGDRAFYFISFHKHNEKKNLANRIANSAGLGKLFQVNIKHPGTPWDWWQVRNNDRKPEINQKSCLSWEGGGGEKVQERGYNHHDQLLLILSRGSWAPTAPRSKGSGHVAPQAACVLAALTTLISPPHRGSAHPVDKELPLIQVW